MATKANDKATRDTLTRVEWQHDGTALVTIRGFEPLRFNPMRASLLNRNYAAQFGWDNRIKNKTSVKADETTGKVDTAKKYRLAKELIEFYEQGGDDWDMKPGARTSGGADAGLTIMALMRVKEVDLDGAEAIIKRAMDKHGVERKDVLANFAKNDAIIRAVADIKAERAAASRVNAADMLNELDDEAEEGADEPDEMGDELTEEEAPDDEAPM